MADQHSRSPVSLQFRGPGRDSNSLFLSSVVFVVQCQVVLPATRYSRMVRYLSIPRHLRSYRWIQRGQHCARRFQLLNTPPVLPLSLRSRPTRAVLASREVPLVARSPGPRTAIVAPKCSGLCCYRISVIAHTEAMNNKRTIVIVSANTRVLVGRSKEQHSLSETSRGSDLGTSEFGRPVVRW